MRAALAIILVLFFGGAALAQDRATEAKTAYQKLPKDDIEKHPTEPLPDGAKVTRIDVTERMHSSSFGHSSTIVLPDRGDVFFVEFGKSTNRPGGFYGPFPLNP